MKSMEGDVSAVKDGVKAVEEGMSLYRQASRTISVRGLNPTRTLAASVLKKRYGCVSDSVTQYREMHPKHAWVVRVGLAGACEIASPFGFGGPIVAPISTLAATDDRVYFWYCRVQPRRLRPRPWRRLVESSGSASSTRLRFLRITFSSPLTCWAREGSAKFTWPITTATTRLQR